MQASCTSVGTEPFLTATIHYLDCSGQRIGAYGFTGLGADGGPAATLVTAGLTIAIALFGIRLMFGERVGIRRPVSLVARIALVFLLAFSWPAARTLFFDVAFNSPAQVAGKLTETPEGAGPFGGLATLQATDTAILAMTAWGTGRDELNSVRTVDGQPAAQAFSSVAVSDRLAMGSARVFFLSSAVLLTGGLRLLGGILFALLPLIAVFALFRPSEGIIWGWMRAMLAVTLSSAAGAVLLALETSFALPWLSARIAERAQSLATPGAPTELLVIVMVTAVMATISIIVLTRICFGHFPLLSASKAATFERQENAERQPARLNQHIAVQTSSRELVLAGSVSRLVAREGRAMTLVSMNSASSDFAGRDRTAPSSTRAPVSARHQLRQSRAARLRSGM